MPNVPYPYEVNWQLVTANGSLTPIWSLSKRSLSPSLTVAVVYHMLGCQSLNDFEAILLFWQGKRDYFVEKYQLCTTFNCKERGGGGCIMN